MNATIPYQAPREPGRWPSLALAAIVHLALFSFLWIGIRWQNETPATMEAEVWDMTPREAAPKEPDPIPEQPHRQPIIEEPRENPEIAIEQEKKRQAAIAMQKALQEEKAEKKKQDNAKKIKAEQDKKTQEKIHEADLKRMMSQIGTGGNGSATNSTSARADDYSSLITNIIKHNIIYGGNTDVPGNPRAIFKIEQLPSGDIFSIKKVKSSGIPAFDNAVEKAIAKSSPLPKKKNGTVEREIEATFNLKELP